MKILKILATIILLTFMILFMINTVRAPMKVIEDYGCLTCSIFDEECPEGFDTEENTKCLYDAEFPFKFAALINASITTMIFIMLCALWGKGSENKKTI